MSTLFGAGTTALLERNTLVDSSVGLLVGYLGSSETTTVAASFNRIVSNDSGVQSISALAALTAAAAGGMSPVSVRLEGALGLAIIRQSRARSPLSEGIDVHGLEMIFLAGRCRFG